MRLPEGLSLLFRGKTDTPAHPPPTPLVFLWTLVSPSMFLQWRKVTQHQSPICFITCLHAKLSNLQWISQNSSVFVISNRSSFYTVMFTFGLLKEVKIDWLSNISILITIFSSYDPKKCLTECVDAFNDLFFWTEINKWLLVGMSPNIGKYHLK